MEAGTQQCDSACYGDFEKDVWESYVLPDGITYTSKPKTTSNYSISFAIPNGIGRGWNTTENKTYQGSLFEVWPLNNLPAEKTDTKVTVDRTYSRLRLRIPKSTRTTNVLKWARESGADGYVIFGNKCNTNGHTYKMVQKAVIENGKTTTWTDRKLKKGVYYKYYIKAYKLVNGKKVWIAVSKVVHSTTTGGKYGNAKSVRVNKSSVSLATGKKFTIKAKQIVKKLPIMKHTVIKFESSNSKVASVSDKGVIKAKEKGVCYIYVYAQNGMYKMIKVKVK